MFALRKNNFFDGKPQMTKQFAIENLKIAKPEIWPFWVIFVFPNLIFFCHFWFPIKNIFFSQSKHTFVLPKTFGG